MTPEEAFRLDHRQPAAGPGMSTIARAALASGHAVVAARPRALQKVDSGSRPLTQNMLPVSLDVTRPQDAQAAVETAARQGLDT